MIETIEVEGIFDGEHMIDTGGKIHRVPANYASKSKLLEGDRLKLTITEDGSFIYKQVHRVEAKKLRGVIVFDEETKRYQVEIKGKYYNVLYASITYFKASIGDVAAVAIPADFDASWAALENILKVGPTTDPSEIEL